MFAAGRYSTRLVQSQDAHAQTHPPLHKAGQYLVTRVTRAGVSLACYGMPLPMLVSGSRAHMLRCGCAASPSAFQPAVPQAQPQLPLAPLEPPPPPLEHLDVTHLATLDLQNFALVEHAHVQLCPGLVALSGGSGAGKSVLLEALNLLLGAAAPPDCVRAPAPAAVLEGRWWLASEHAAAAHLLLEQVGLPTRALPGCADGGRGQGGHLHVRREIMACTAPDGSTSLRSRVLVNGAPSSLRVLRQLGELLVDVNGQHAALGLRDAPTQLALLDRVAGTSGLATLVLELSGRLAGVETRLAGLRSLGDEEQRAALQRRIDLVARARLLPGEDAMLRRQLEALEARRSCLEGAAAVAAGVTGGASSMTGGDGGALLEGTVLLAGQLRGVMAAEEAQARLLAAEGMQDDAHGGGDGGALDDDWVSGTGGEPLAALQDALRALDDAADCLRDVAVLLSRYAAAAEYSAAAAAAAASRLDLVTRLCRRFRAPNVTELLSLAAGWTAQLEAYEGCADRADEWQREATELQAQLTAACLQLSQRRQRAAAVLAQSVEACLARLGMPGSRFAVRLTWRRAPMAAEEQQGVPSSRAVLAPDEQAPGTGMAIPLQEINSSNSACNHSSSSSSSSVGNSASLYALQGPGLDAAAFLLAAGPGEPLRPLATVASGGEAARLLLALKAAPAEAAATTAAAEAALEAAVPLQGERGGAHAIPGTLGAPILVMDELDAGVGSRLGEPVGRLLRCMVASRAASQLIVVTHVPHVAAAASQHVRVAKADAGGGRVVSAFTTLCTLEERTAELADMLGLPGAEGRAMAAELLAAASAPL